MISLHIPDMTCSHCEKSITEAVIKLDNQAQLSFDRNRKTVHILTSANDDQIRVAIEQTGYTSTKTHQHSTDEQACCGHCSA